MRVWTLMQRVGMWGGVAAAVGLGVVWVGSGWWWAQWNDGDGGAVVVDSGRVHCFAIDPSTEACRPRGWRMGVHDFTLSCAGYDDPPDFAGYRSVNVGVLAAGCFVASLVARGCEAAVVRGRERRNLCRACCYDRVGIGAEVRCPECGLLWAEGLDTSSQG